MPPETDRQSCNNFNNNDFENCPGYRELRSKVAGNYEQDILFRGFTKDKLSALEKGQSGLDEQVKKVLNNTSKQHTIQVKNGTIRNITHDEALKDMWERLAEQEEITGVWKDISVFWKSAKKIWSKFKWFILLILIPMTVSIALALIQFASSSSIVQWVFKAGLRLLGLGGQL